MTTMSKSNEIIKAAIEGMEAKKRQINEQIRELRGMLNGAPVASAVRAAGGGRRFSAAGLQRMREAQRRRWARVRGEGTSETAIETTARSKKWRLSAQGRKNIIEATKRYWAAKRAAAAKVGK
jgi:hypothetical protein